VVTWPAQPSDEAPDTGRSAELAGDLVLLDEAERDLGDLDAALRRLDGGTYGTCEVCAATIDDAELTRVPLLRRCGAHVGAPPE
jgi:RNA polymerase-binding transcription factor DksA